MPQLGYSKLPKREEEICLRLREIRERMKWKQVDFAKEFKITRERLASYEYARAPVKYFLARDVCKRFNICQRWLATGALPQRPFFEVNEFAEDLFPEKILLSVSYDKILAEEFEERLEVVAKLRRCKVGELGPHSFSVHPPLFPTARDEDRAALDAVIDRINILSAFMPTEILRSFIRQLFRAVTKFDLPDCINQWARNSDATWEQEFDQIVDEIKKKVAAIFPEK